MPRMQTGNKGNEIRKLQEDLKALELYQGSLDGDFGPQTKKAVLAFQQRYFVDGIVDGHTRDAITKAVIAWAGRDLNILLPVPVGYQKMCDTFGHFDFEEAENGWVDIDPKWVAENIVLADLPIVGRKHVHKKILPVITSVLDEIAAKGLDGEIFCFGSWAARHIWYDPKRSLSIHAWGCAFDVNWPTNPPGRVGDLHPGIVAAFERHGFQWGGRFTSKRDDMHFEYFK